MKFRAQRSHWATAGAFAAAAVVLLAGCGAPEAPAPAPKPASPPVEVERVYRFVEEVPRLDDGNVPQTRVGRETRMVLPGEHRSRWLQLPESARLLAAVGVPGPHDGARFTISLEQENESPVELFSTELAPDASTWRDVEVDLAPYGGKMVRFRFQGDADGDTQPAWGAPRILADTPPDDRPNVILISLDTLRADHLGTYGYDRKTSPNLDAFADDAIVFEQAISTSSWTLPAHASLFTGTSPSEHGAISMGAPVFGGVALAELGFEAGYRTGAVTDGGFVDAARGFGQGFETYLSDRKRVDRRVDEALEWIGSTSGRPYMLFVHTYQVHNPYRPPLEYAERFLPEGADAGAVMDRIDALEKGRELRAEHRDAVVALYDAEVAYLDDQMGRFFDGLRERGHWDNTLIVVFSDHGEQFWEHHQYGHGVSLHEEEIRIPLIVKLAGRFEPGRRDDLVSLSDVYATVAEIMQWQREPASGSRSFRNLLEAEPAAGTHRDYVISEVGMRRTSWEPIPPTPRQLSYRAPDWKIITDERSDALRYYDLLSDPFEKNDAADRIPEAARARADAFKEYVNETAAFLFRTGDERRAPPDLSPEQEEELEALGYFQ